MNLYEFFRKFEEVSWDIFDGGIKAILNLAVILPIAYFINTKYKLDTVTFIIIFFSLSLIIGTILSKLIKINFGDYLKNRLGRK